MKINKQKKALIVLEDGTVFSGYSFGASGIKFGEIVFNTSMSGYQEILTDPSYKGQIVTMTYPLIGNYGVNNQDVESERPFVSGFVVKECAKLMSNWRAQKSLPQYLQENEIIGIQGIDTRGLTLQIRRKGAMKAVVSTEEFNIDKLISQINDSTGIVGVDLVKEVTRTEIFYPGKQAKYSVVVIDCGVKSNILRQLEALECALTVVPANIKFETILELKPDGVMFSNGPGDPAALDYVVNTAKQLIGKIPVFGICLGLQILGMALGGKTYKLKFGHHGANHPVKDFRTGRVAITVQNHGFCLDINSLPDNAVMATHINLNDQTLAGIRHKTLPLFAVQFHPEACPGPHDAMDLFKEFILMMDNTRDNYAKKK
ncbi:MAG: carbamoyl phosphate synthase small subunit [Candidatus Omnitrophota bacterium]|nr:MAG: carbamoyl phosphate synthase small subunit [Candidatus Omnitrophota bacterium]